MGIHYRSTIVLAFIVVSLLGFLAGQAFRAEPVQAQPVQAQPVQAQPVQAQPREWRECISLSLWGHDGAEVGEPNFRIRPVTIPRGWSPVGGAGTQNTTAVVLCR
ncbi:MAG: hypothetical protein IT378_17940 [Sandaracinaceae bacterium]|nr:hypothetical protein [Sandaracinaceae bacterium]